MNREAVDESHALAGELVEIRRHRVGIAVAAEVRADVLGGDPEDIRPATGRVICGVQRRRQGQQHDRGEAERGSHPDGSPFVFRLRLGAGFKASAGERSLGRHFAGAAVLRFAAAAFGMLLPTRSTRGLLRTTPC